MDTGTRKDLLTSLVNAIGSVTIPHPTRVALDGPPAAGKTTLADDLAAILRAHGRTVIRASIEDFLNPRSQRYRRGEYSAEGCYQDGFNLDALHRVLLNPLGPHGTRGFQHAVYDRTTDTAPSPSQPFTTAPANAVLLFDGVFLLRPELIDQWDLSIFVAVTFDKTLARARARDQTPSNPPSEVERRYRGRYMPSQQLYFDAVHPTDHADIIVHNDDLQRPTWEIRTP